MTIKPNRLQIIQFLIDEGITNFKEKPERGELLINSPFVRDYKNKCGINYRKGGAWNCFKSGNYGSWWSFVSFLKGFESNKESQLWFLRNYFSMDQIKSNFISEDDDSVNVVESDLFFGEETRPITPNDKIYISYLKKRHFTDDMIKELKIFINHKERRITFPVYENGKLIFYAARSIDKENPIRWLNSLGASSHPIWNLENVRDEIWIFEGIFDAVRIWPKGIAIFGLTLRDEQLKKIIDKNPYKVVVIGDGDEPGRKGQKRIIEKLIGKVDNLWFHLWEPGFKDFGEMIDVKPNLFKVDEKWEMNFMFNEKINFKQ